MNIFGEKLHSFGLDISDTSLKLVNLEKRMNKLVIESWNKITLKEGLIKDGEIINPTELADQINTLIKTSHGPITSKLVVANLPESKTFLKVITIPKENLESTSPEKIIDSELPKHIPVPLNELNYDWMIPDRGDHSSSRSIIIAAAPLNIIRQYTELLYFAGLSPLALELNSLAAARAIFFNDAHKDNKKNEVKNNKAKIVIDLGKEASQIMIFDNCIIKFTNRLGFSSNDVTKSIAAELRISVYDAERAKINLGLSPKKGKGAVKNIINEFLLKLTADINKSMEYYKQNFPEGNQIDEIILIGGGANMPNLAEDLNLNLRLKVTLGSLKINTLTFKKEEKSGQKNLTSLITAIGLAMREFI